jgi:hypothetical protein
LPALSNVSAFSPDAGPMSVNTCEAPDSGSTLSTFPAPKSATSNACVDG